MPTPPSLMGRALRPEILALARACAHCRVVHHVPGRIRLRFDPIGLAAALAGDMAFLQRQLGRLVGILRTEVNPGACSVVVHYDRAALPTTLWDRVFAGDPAVATTILDGLLPGSSSSEHAVSSQR